MNYSKDGKQVNSQTVELYKIREKYLKLLYIVTIGHENYKLIGDDNIYKVCRNGKLYNKIIADLETKPLK